MDFSRCAEGAEARQSVMTARAAALPNWQARLAFTGRKFHAWWEGYAFDEAAERAALQADFPFAGIKARPAGDLIAEAIWGEGRLEPGSPAWTMHFARLLSLPVRANVVIFGAGAGGVLNDIRLGTRWRSTGLTRAEHVARGNLRSYDMAVQRRSKAKADGAMSFFELHQEANPASFSAMVSEMLTPGSKAVFVEYCVARKGVRLRSCFPTAKHGAPKTAAQYQEAIRNAGFVVNDGFDETQAFIQMIAKGWAGWRRAYAAISNIENVSKRAELTRAMAVHAHLWAERLDAMKSGQLLVIAIRATRS